MRVPCTAQVAEPRKVSAESRPTREARHGKCKRFSFCRRCQPGATLRTKLSNPAGDRHAAELTLVPSPIPDRLLPKLNPCGQEADFVRRAVGVPR